MTSPPGEQHIQLNVTRHDKRFAEVLAPLPEGQHGVYGLGRAWQLSSTQVGIVANIRSWGSDVVDLELGNDLLIIDSLDTMQPSAVIPLNRSENTEAGASYLPVKYPLCGNFVPLGALRADGSPYPHAGTGFAFCLIKRFPLNEKGEISIRYIGEMQGNESHGGFELQQYRYDGETFTIEQTEIIAPNDFLDGWRLNCPPLGSGIPDGDDFLAGVIGRPADSTLGMGERGDHESGSPYLARWKRTDGRWHLAEVSQVSHVVDYIEPSLIRDTNGDLLYSARDWDMRPNPLVSVWRSTDNGSTWEQAIEAEGVRSQSPCTLNQALDGTPYLASCPLEDDKPTYWARSRLHLWPLSQGRDGVLPPSLARDALAEFGEPTHVRWYLDHPIASTIRLADGRWHHVLCYRIMEGHGAPPTETTGLYVEEVLTERTIEPPWRF